MKAEILMIVLGVLMVLSFSITPNSKVATRAEVMQIVDAGGSETLLEGY